VERLKNSLEDAQERPIRQDMANEADGTMEGTRVLGNWPR